jgi:hypothetical protein
MHIVFPTKEFMISVSKKREYDMAAVYENKSGLNIYSLRQRDENYCFKDLLGLLLSYNSESSRRLHIAFSNFINFRSELQFR